MQNPIRLLLNSKCDGFITNDEARRVIGRVNAVSASFHLSQEYR